ncbi:MAG: lysophospholipid acyltransferase family protein [Thermoguttaceae bacterium]
MMLSHQFFSKLFGFLAAPVMRGWFATLDCKAVYHNEVIEPAFGLDHQRRIFLFWHEHLLLPLSLWGNCEITMLLSQHNDASLVATLAHQFGYDCVRGSSGRGSVRAIREMLMAGTGRHLTITPDGPRGPRRQMAPGAVFLAAKLQLPIVLLGVGFERPYRFNSWDKFAIPKIGSRVRIILSDDHWVPASLDKESLEAHRLHLENELTSLTNEATLWAESGRTMFGEKPKLVGPKCSMLYNAAPSS